MAKEYQFNWRVKLPDILLNGDTFDRYDDESNTLDLSCAVRFEEFGLFMIWTPKNKDAGILDVTQIWEARSSGTIKDVRVLFDLEQRGFKESVEARTVYITYGQDIVSVNSLFLVAKSSQVAKEWRQAVNDFVRNYKFRHTCPMQCLQKHWRSLCLATNERGRIPLKNIVKTFASGKPDRMVHKCLTDLGLAGDKYIFSKRAVINKKSWTGKLSNVYKCGTGRGRKKKEREDLDVSLFTFEKFLRLYYKICPRTDVQELFVRLSGQREFLTKERLTSFLNEEQRDPRLNEILFPFFDGERVRQLIAKYETDESYIAQGKMSGDGFLRFLLSDENAPVFLDRTELYQEMDQPLCHYYISSSHNTYLTGRQYGGKSSTEIYRQVLLSGCRCIELDCWDGTGENKGEPIITHGKAMCTDVFFRDVLYQIRDTAFARSDLPVILSFENHCSKSNQLKMAKYCMEILGDMLLAKPLDDHPLEAGVPLPSPNRLKRKILIKNKRLKSDVEKHQLEQFLREGKLDEDEETNETPEVANEDISSAPNSNDEVPATEQDVIAAAKEVAKLSSNPIRTRSSFSMDGGASTSNSTLNQNHLLQASSTPMGAQTPSDSSSCANTSAATTFAVTTPGDGKEHDEAHPELKQNFISKLKPLSFTKKSQHQQSQQMTAWEQQYLGASANDSSCLSGPTNAHSDCGSLSSADALSTPAASLSFLSGSSSGGGGGFLTSIGRSAEKRSFRRLSNTSAITADQQHQLMAATLLDAVPKRNSSQRSSKSKKAEFLLKKPILTKEEEERIFAEYNYTGATTNIHPLLSSLINYTHPVKFSGFDIAEGNDLHFHMSSFSESTGLGYLKQSAPEFVNYNKRQLSRIYPKGARVDSSNFLPQIFWNAGCQMVALNFQTPDVCMQLNQGKFDYNGGCGYLLKPDFMRRPDRSFDPFSESPVDGVIAAHCSVKIISGQFLCDRKVGTYIEVEMYGLPTDTIRKEHRTRTVPANGLNPIYNDDPFVFRKVVLPELAVLRFAVYDENGKQLGQRILPLDGLQAGYRHISLRTESNMSMTLPTLFVHLVLKTYVPDELSGLVDALADPRAYVSAQEKRKEALHLMGVDDSDIVEVVPAFGGGGANTIGGAIAGGNASKQQNVSSSVFLKQQKQNGITSNIDGRVNTIHSSSLSSYGAREGSASGYSQKPSNENLLIANQENKFKLESIDLNELRKDKLFQKLQKRHQKDLDEIKKRHLKQREIVQKQQQISVEKMLGDNHKSSTKKRGVNISGGSSIGSQHSSLSERSSNPPSTLTDSVITTNNATTTIASSIETTANKKIRDLVSSQTDEYSKLVRSHELENFELRKKQIREEYDLLKKLLSDTQKQQIFTMKVKFEAENKELKQAQTKKSMDDTKSIQQDKGIKTKAERDRRVKELNEKNVKMFVEERKRLATKCRRHEEQLEKRHAEQADALEKEIAKALEQEEMNHCEAVLASRPESIV